MFGVSRFTCWTVARSSMFRRFKSDSDETGDAAVRCSVRDTTG
jgi:hypothetical protein